MPWPRKQSIAIFLQKKKELGEKAAKEWMAQHDPDWKHKKGKKK
jgi:hypothetical protein